MDPALAAILGILAFVLFILFLQKLAKWIFIIGTLLLIIFALFWLGVL